MLRFGHLRNLQKFAAVHASVSNHFAAERNLAGRNLFETNRATALEEWCQLGAA